MGLPGSGLDCPGARPALVGPRAGPTHTPALEGLGQHQVAQPSISRARAREFFEWLIGPALPIGRQRGRGCRVVLQRRRRGSSSEGRGIRAVAAASGQQQRGQGCRGSGGGVGEAKAEAEWRHLGSGGSTWMAAAAWRGWGSSNHSGAAAAASG
jgi:hypothetical protein